MVLWTIHPTEVYELIQRTGGYHCDFSRSVLSHCKEQYDWLAEEINDWMRRGDSIQATFWELRNEHIRKVRFFTAAPMPDYLKNREES